jgi:EpsI family protein
MKRYRITVGLLLASALVSWGLALSQAVGYGVRLDELPMTLGAWEGAPDRSTRLDLLQAVLETSTVLERTYVKRGGGGDRLALLVTYFERGHRGFHPPEVSFVASGHTIVRADHVAVLLSDDPSGPRLAANRFLGRTPTGEVLFLYWFGVGDEAMASYYRAFLVRLWDAVLQRPRPASMVRVALPVMEDVERTMATATEFVRLLVPVLADYLVERPRTPARPSG